MQVRVARFSMQGVTPAASHEESHKLEDKGSDGEEAHVPGTQPGMHTIDVALIEAMKRALYQPASKEGGGYCPSAASWSPEEITSLEEALQRYGPESLSVVSRCVKIAALLPHKGAREVAARMRLMDLQREQAALPQEERLKRARVDAAALQAASRQAAALLYYHNPLMSLPTPSPQASTAKPAAPTKADAVNELLEENGRLLQRMGEQHASLNVTDNVPLTLQLSDNCQHITAYLAGLNVKLPPLPVYLDTRLIHLVAMNEPALQDPTKERVVTKESVAQAASATAAVNLQAAMMMQQGSIKSPLSVFSNMCMSPPPGH